MLKHRYFTISIIAILLVALIGQVYAATSPTFGASGSYSVLAGTTVTNTGPTVIDGDVGVSPGSAVDGFPPGIVNLPYTIHTADGSAANAQLDNAALFDALSAGDNAACTVDYGAVTEDLAGKTLTPGVYCANAFTLSGTLNLDDASADDVWIFRSVLSTLNTDDGVGATVQFVNEIASVCNVWWKVASSATIGTGTTFIGNILALTSIDLDTNATLEGRAFAQNGAVTLDSNTINPIVCLDEAAPVPTATPGGPRRTATPGTGLPAFPGTGSGAPIFNEVSPWNLLIIAGVLGIALFVGGRSLRKNNQSK